MWPFCILYGPLARTKEFRIHINIFKNIIHHKANYCQKKIGTSVEIFSRYPRYKILNRQAAGSNSNINYVFSHLQQKILQNNFFSNIKITSVRWVSQPYGQRQLGPFPGCYNFFLRVSYKNEECVLQRKMSDEKMLFSTKQYNQCRKITNGPPTEVFGIASPYIFGNFGINCDTTLC